MEIGNFTLVMQKDATPDSLPQFQWINGSNTDASSKNKTLNDSTPLPVDFSSIIESDDIDDNP